MQFADERGKVFVGGLSWDTTHGTMMKYFSRYGEVIDCVVMKNQTTGKSRGFGFVTFKDPACVEMVLSSGPHVLDGRQIDPKSCNPRSMNKGGKSTENSKRKIFIGGLPSNITEEQLREQFAKYGNVTDVVIMFDQQKQRSRGFGFLTFDTEECVDRVVQEHFIHVNGKQVEVKKAEPRDLKMMADAASAGTLVFAQGPCGAGALSLLSSPLANASGALGLVSANPYQSALASGWCQSTPQGLHIVGPSSSLVLLAPGGAGAHGIAMSSPANGLTYQTWPPVKAEFAIDLYNAGGATSPSAALQPQMPSVSYNTLIRQDPGTMFALNTLGPSHGFGSGSPFTSFSTVDSKPSMESPVAGATAYVTMGSYDVGGLGALRATFGGSIIAAGGAFATPHNSSNAGFMTAPTIGRFPTSHTLASPGFHPYRR